MAGTVQDVLTAIRGLDSRLQEEAMKSLFMAYRGVPGVSSGRSFNDDVNLAASGDAAGQGSGSAGQASLPGVDSMFGFVGEPYAIPSFTMFQDPNVSADEDSPWICFHPSVTAGEVSVDVVEPDGYESGNTYYCHVYRSGSDWKAVINNEPNTAEGDPDSRVSVKIAKLPADSSDDPVEQYHVGTIVVDGGGGKFLASFTAYDNGGSIDLFNPLVATPAGIITAGGTTTKLGAGTYYCHVKKTKSGDTYTATVDTSENDSTLTSQEEAVVTTKICKISTSGEGPDQKTVVEEQYHVGTIVVDGGGGKFLASFTAYDNGGSIDLFNPLVATPAGIITAGGTTTKLGAGTYYCHVKKTKSGDTYTATVDTSENDSTLTSQEEAVVTTKICKISTSGEGPDQKTVVEEQYHVGTIVVDGAGGGGKFLASFAVYEGAAGLTMFDPVVACPPDTTLTPAAPNPLVAGTYYCHVWRSGEWGYSANIDTSSSHSGGGKPVLDVKICDIVNGADKKPVLSKQYHVGVICADARTGLRVKSAGSLLTSSMGAGQTDDVSRKVELDFTEKLTKHLAMTVTATGDGKDGATIKLDEDDSVKGTTVVTGFKSLTVDGGKLRLVASTAKIRFPIIEGSEAEATVEMAVSETPVVVGSKYDESTGKFTNTVKKATVLTLTDEGDKDVFTAVKFPECPSLTDG